MSEPDFFVPSRLNPHLKLWKYRESNPLLYCKLSETLIPTSIKYILIPIKIMIKYTLYRFFNVIQIRSMKDRDHKEP